MATLTSVNGDNRASEVASPAVKLDAAENKGKLRRLYDSYTIDAADEFGTSGLISMMTIPSGARIVDARFIAPASGATGICNIGWAAGATGAEAADDDGLFVLADPGGGAVDSKMSGTVAGYNKKFSEEVLVQIDVTEVTADSGGDTWQLEIFYVVD